MRSRAFDLLDRGPLLLDGGMGTMLMEAGWGPPVLPEELNAESPRTVERIHRAYLEAGAEIIETNSFGGSTVKLSHRGIGEMAFELAYKAALIAREAAGSSALVAGSVGPLGLLVEPLGELSVEEAISAFAPQVRGLVEGGVDFVLFETMMDLMEVKAAILALKRWVGDFPFAVSFTFEQGGSTVTGTPPSVAAAFARSMGAFAVGANCGFGPSAYRRVLEELSSSGMPIIFYPNAGVKGEEGYLEPEAFAEETLRVLEGIPVWAVGGCCGTTPAHIRVLRERLGEVRGFRGSGRRVPLELCSRSKLVVVDDRSPVLLVGERINVSRKGPIQEEIRSGLFRALREEAISQERAGAMALDVNVGLPEIDRVFAMRRAVLEVQKVSSLPVSVDSDELEVLEAGLSVACGVPVMNSLSLRGEVLERGIELAKLYGAVPVVLLLDEAGIPETLEGRVRLLEELSRRLEDLRFPKERVLVDCLTLAVGASPEGPKVALKAIEEASKMGFWTIMGISNVSHGMPGRSALNAAFYAMAVSRGLCAVIANPLDPTFVDVYFASNLLVGRDKDASSYIGRFGSRAQKPSTPQGSASPEVVEAKASQKLFEAVVRGLSDGVEELAEAALEEVGEPLELVERVLIPALEEVGRRYERCEYFLPNLIMSAGCAKAVSEVVSRALRSRGIERRSRGKVVLATVYGDLHDLGKNIVKMVLENHGYEVVDLGKDVKRSRIFEAIEEHDPDVVGLSALMTTTMREMAEVTREIKERGYRAKVIVGGACVTPSFARGIGADGYSKDAVTAARLVGRLLSGEEGFIAEV